MNQYQSNFYTLRFEEIFFAFLRITVEVKDPTIFDQEDRLACLELALEETCSRNSPVPICIVRSSIVRKPYITMNQLDQSIKELTSLKVIEPSTVLPERWVEKDETTMILSPYYAWGVGRSLHTSFVVGKEIDEKIGKIIGGSFSYHWKTNNSITFVIAGKSSAIDLKRRGPLRNQFVFLNLPSQVQKKLGSFPNTFVDEVQVDMFLLVILTGLAIEHLSTYDDYVAFSNYLSAQKFDERVIAETSGPETLLNSQNFLNTSVDLRVVTEMWQARLNNVRRLLLNYSKSATTSFVKEEFCKELRGLENTISTLNAKKAENERLISQVPNILQILILKANYEVAKTSKDMLTSIGTTATDIHNITEKIQEVQKLAQDTSKQAEDWSRKMGVTSLFISVLAIASILGPIFSFYYGSSSEEERNNTGWLALWTVFPTLAIAIGLIFYFRWKMSSLGQNEGSRKTDKDRLATTGK